MRSVTIHDDGDGEVEVRIINGGTRVRYEFESWEDAIAELANLPEVE